MRLLIFTLLIPWLLSSCKSPQKSASGSSLNQETSISNDMSLSEDTHLSEVTDRIIKRLTNEQLKMSVKQTKYDTGKPMDQKTGRHPVAEVIEVSISKETGVSETDSIRQKANHTSVVELKNHSEADSKIKAEAKEEKETGLLKKWQTVLITIGGSVLAGLVVFILIKPGFRNRE